MYVLKRSILATLVASSLAYAPFASSSLNAIIGAKPLCNRGFNTVALNHAFLLTHTPFQARNVVIGSSGKLDLKKGDLNNGNEVTRIEGLKGIARTKEVQLEQKNFLRPTFNLHYTARLIKSLNVKIYKVTANLKYVINQKVKLEEELKAQGYQPVVAQSADDAKLDVVAAPADPKVGNNQIYRQLDKLNYEIKKDKVILSLLNARLVHLKGKGVIARDPDTLEVLD